MGSSYAYPVMQTGDALAAFRMAERLFGIAETLQYAEPTAWATLSTLEDVERILPVLPPGAWLDSGEGAEAKWFHPHELPADASELAALLPLSLHLEDAVPFRSFEADLAAVVGSVPAGIRWHLGAWPATPTQEWRSTKYSGVELAFNCRELWGDPADGHMLSVCVGQNDLQRAEWLAAQVGLRVLGPPVQSL
ncbi:hypothetical protein ACH4U5_40090 [Streptomyces sp. NPDC020858]|uniref:hypothetical protein n=1 Tax=Streptomyces sp. NPDC020858 TaxID=3365097 RepID=UPI00378F205F